MTRVGGRPTSGRDASTATRTGNWSGSLNIFKNDNYCILVRPTSSTRTKVTVIWASGTLKCIDEARRTVGPHGACPAMPRTVYYQLPQIRYRHAVWQIHIVRTMIQNDGRHRTTVVHEDVDVSIHDANFVPIDIDLQSLRIEGGRIAHPRGTSLSLWRKWEGLHCTRADGLRGKKTGGAFVYYGGDILSPSEAGDEQDPQPGTVPLLCL